MISLKRLHILLSRLCFDQKTSEIQKSFFASKLVKISEINAKNVDTFREIFYCRHKKLNNAKKEEKKTKMLLKFTCLHASGNNVKLELFCCFLNCVVSDVVSLKLLTVNSLVTVESVLVTSHTSGLSIAGYFAPTLRQISNFNVILYRSSF